MDAHKRQEHCGLDPADQALLILLGSILVVRAEKTAGVEGPPGQTRSHLAEAACDLTLHRNEIIADVAGPGHYAVALDAGEGASRQDHRFVVRNVLQAGVHGAVHHQRINIAVELAGKGIVSNLAAGEVVVLGFRGVEPPSIYPVRDCEGITETLHIIVHSLWVEEVYPVRSVDIIPALLQSLSESARMVDLGPDGDHEAGIHIVKGLCEGRWIGIMLGVELHGVPAGLAPPLPVLDDHIERNSALLETIGILDDLVLRMVAFAAVDIAKHPFGHLGNRACECTISGDHFVRSASKHRIIQGLGHWRAVHGLVRDLAPIEDRRVATHSLSGYRMLPCGKGDECGRGRRQPGIREVYHLLAVDGEVMTASHLLPHIIQQGILPCLGHLESPGERPCPAHLAAVARCAGSIDGLTASGLGLGCESHAVVGRVEVRQAIVVPKQAIAFAGKHEGDGDLGIDLSQATRDAPDVEETVLELAGTIEMFVGRRCKSLRHRVNRNVLDGRSLDLPSSRNLGEDNVSVSIEEHQRAVGLGVAGCHRIRLHLYEGRILADRVFGSGNLFCINEFFQKDGALWNQLDTDGIGMQRTEDESPILSLDLYSLAGTRASAQQDDAQEQSDGEAELSEQSRHITLR